MRRFFALVLSLGLFVSPAFASSAPILRHGTAEKKVALTFDDGPHKTYTPEILDILKEYGVHATFFEIGENVRAHPELARRVIEEGHEIGNHTDSHRFLNRLTDAALAREIADAEESIEEACGVKPHLFRPPGGGYSDQKIALVSEMGYTSVLWTKDTRDWSCPGVERVVDAALDGLTGGDIILFHDFNGGKSPTPAALRRIIPAILERGFAIVPVSELLENA